MNSQASPLPPRVPDSRAMTLSPRAVPLLLLALLAGGWGFAACAPEQAIEPTTCAELVEKAAFEVEIDDEVKWFDKAILTCGSFEQIASEIKARGRVTNYTTEEFLKRRCQDNAETLATTAVCRVVAPATTIAEIVENPSYTGETLDGEEITVTPDEVEFVGKFPAVIAKTVELAENASCVAVIGVRDDWANFVGPSRGGKIASMYAQHAQNVANFIGCINDPVVVAPAPAAPPTTAAP